MLRNEVRIYGQKTNCFRDETKQQTKKLFRENTKE